MLILEYDHSDMSNPVLISDVYTVISDLEGMELIKAVNEKTGIPHTREYVMDRPNFGKQLSRYFFLYTANGEQCVVIDTFREDCNEKL